MKPNTLASKHESIKRQGYSCTANMVTSVLAPQNANLVGQNADASQSQLHRLLSYNELLCDFRQRKIKA